MQGRAPAAIRLPSQRSASHWAAWLGARRLRSVRSPLLRPPAVCRAAFQESGQRPSTSGLWERCWGAEVAQPLGQKAVVHVLLLPATSCRTKTKPPRGRRLW